MLSGCSQGKKEEVADAEDQNDRYFLKRHVSAESELKIKAFCGDCHKMPLAANFPIDKWKHEVERGFDFYTQSGRDDLVRPNVYDSIAYFTQRAPSREEFVAELDRIPKGKELARLFKEVRYNSIGTKPSISNVEFFAAKKGFVSTDMFDGKVYFQPLDRLEDSRSILTTESPINSTVCDLDQDGTQDLLISDIGEYKAADASRGKIVWLKQRDDEYVSTTLASGLGRVCQTLVSDFDQDGDQDILVAEFGYFETGSIFLLKNNGKEIGPDAFEKIEIDNRHGTVRMQVVDIDGDGDHDFFASIAQEIESVELFVNNGQAEFESQSIFMADYPSYGSSGIEVTDLDNDGDLDVLYTNGDTFDSMVPKKYHSIQWLENDGKLNFVRHELAQMPGVHCARAGDFDADGDIDIVACAFMSNEETDLEFESIVYLENNGQMQFERYRIEANTLFYPNLTVGDFNGDGFADFAVGTTDIGDGTIKTNPIRVFLNNRESKSIPRP